MMQEQRIFLGGVMRGAVANKFFLICAVIIMGCIFWYLTTSHDDKIAHIKLGLGQDGYITVNLPRKYIGPSKLELSQEVINASNPVNMIPLAFTYPGFQPWKKGLARLSMSKEEKAREVLLILQGGLGEKHGMNNHVYWILGFYDNKKCHAEPYPEKQYGLHHYKRFFDCLTSNKYHGQDIYFYDAPSDSARDAMITCPPPEHVTEKCRFYINLDDKGIISADFSAQRTLLPNWQKVVSDYQDFITPFYVEEIAHMQKPTRMSKEHRLEINQSAQGDWKL